MTAPSSTLERKTLTEQQYVELRSYEHGRPSSRVHPPMRALVSTGMITHCYDDFYSISPAGLDALAAFRTSHRLPPGV